MRGKSRSSGAGARRGWYLAFGKRAFDLAVAVPVSILVLPLAAAVTWQIRRRLGSPVLFRQPRAGLHGRPFTVYKFRTMTDERRPDGSLAEDAERLTPLGRFLRSSSLDEIPGLINVLRGEMSLVGPRPLHLHYLERYTPEQNRRHEVPPGITGWAAVNGRNAQTWEQKFEHDVWYVDHVSPRLDLEILLRTLVAVFQRRGISQEGHATAEEFMGRGVE
jgi:lipopolysaccharide/colanic/teichoic acid biosynthesis glycosyltransferase